MTISPLSLIILLGATQGFILATLLWLNQKGHRLSNRLLATLIGLLALMSFSVGIPTTNRFVGLFMELVPMIMAMPLGPLIFFYTRSILDPSFRLGKKEKRHFYPVIFDWGSKIIGWVFIIGMLLGFFPQKEGPAWGYVMDEYNAYVDIPRWLSVTVYLFLTRQVLSRHQVALNSTSTEQQQSNVKWLRQFVNAFLIFQSIWLIHLVPYIIPTFREPLLDRFGWYPIYIPIAVLIYWLGFRGYLHTRVTTSSQQIPKSTSAELSEETVRQVTSSLSNVMVTERLFLDPELTVEKLGAAHPVGTKTYLCRT